MVAGIKRCLVISLLLFTASQASAGWTGCKLFDGQTCVHYEIADIFSDVAAVNNNLNGFSDNTVLKDFRLQREAWLPFTEDARLIPDGLRDLLEALPAVREEFFSFVGSPKCSFGSECFVFREDLVQLFADLDGLKSKFPSFEKLGLADGGRSFPSIS
jgi:hypothetical protein